MAQKKFFNQVHQDMHWAQFWKWIFTRSPGPWRKENHNKPYPLPPERVTQGALFTFVNHATFLIQVDGLNLLTDPIWSERASPFSFIGPKRARLPGVAFNDLPPIDAVIISHNHYDHLDISTLKRLQARDNPLLVAGLNHQKVFKKHGLERYVELDWWQEHPLSGKVQLAAVPAQHFSGRTLSDRDQSLWMGVVIKSTSGHFFFAGDTGLGPHFEQIKERYAPIDVALIPIGAFIPQWFMGYVHLSPKDAVEAANILQAKKSIGMHFGTFKLADDGQDEPLEHLKEALAQCKKPPDFGVLDFGESYRLDKAPLLLECYNLRMGAPWPKNAKSKRSLSLGK